MIPERRATNEVDSMIAQVYYMQAVSKLQITKVNTNGTQKPYKVEDRRDSEKSLVRSRQPEFTRPSNGNKGVT